MQPAETVTAMTMSVKRIVRTADIVVPSSLLLRGGIKILFLYKNDPATGFFPRSVIAPAQLRRFLADPARKL
jgi:hypothetical protein